MSKGTKIVLGLFISFILIIGITIYCTNAYQL
jgi:hypothetical protein